MLSIDYSMPANIYLKIVSIISLFNFITDVKIAAKINDVTSRQNFVIRRVILRFMHFISKFLKQQLSNVIKIKQKYFAVNLKNVKYFCNLAHNETQLKAGAHFNQVNLVYEYKLFKCPIRSD